MVVKGSRGGGMLVSELQAGTHAGLTSGKGVAGDTGHGLAQDGGQPIAAHLVLKILQVHRLLGAVGALVVESFQPQTGGTDEPVQQSSRNAF